MALLHGLCRLHTVDDGHADVHEDDVGHVLLDEREELLPVLREARDLHVLVLPEHDAETFADELLVVRNHDFDHQPSFLSDVSSISASFLSGMMTVREKPRVPYVCPLS